jgi:ATP-dependent exoDNAse (exonuclease V) alpha subunit
MTEGLNLFEYIGGAAGCGKTWLARERVRQAPMSTRLCASTGIAAINLGQSEFTCTTINSLLWYFNTESLESNWAQGKLDMALRGLWEGGIRTIVIDEVSMMSGRQIDVICMGIDYLNEQRGFDAGEPMGLVLIGDFCQLPPVEELKEGFAFEADRWERFAENTTILHEIKRQTDVDFVEALQKVRSGNGQEAVEFFKPFMNNRLDIEFEGTTIMSKNLEVNRFNERRLSRLDTDSVRFPSYRFGKQLKEWEKNIPQVFETKLDALVMILVNKSIPNSGGEFEYVNGDLGYIRDVTEKSASVELMRNDYVVEVEYSNKENNKVVDGRDLVVGNCEHMPLRTAYATTCHKSQGLTLDRVQINLNGQFFGYGGMAYVALSRARSQEGLRVVVGRPETFIKRCKTNPKVEQWL